MRHTIVEHAYEISPDVDLQFRDADGATGLSFEKKDELEFYDKNEVVAKMEVPGFEDWYNEYAVKADFANTCMELDFDSESWNKRGIELAQEIREQLPEKYDLWYGYPFEDERNRYRRPRLIY